MNPPSQSNEPQSSADRDSDPDMAEAVTQVLAGQADAFARIVRRFQTPLMSLGMAMLRDPQAAEELTQDAFVRAYRHLQSFDTQRPMFPWLARIAYRLACDRLRNRSQAIELTAEAAIPAPTSHDPLMDLVAEERGRQLWRSVHKLAEGERVSVLLYYREAMTVEQVAQVMEVSTGTVKTQLYRARIRLRKMMEETETESPREDCR